MAKKSLLDIKAILEEYGEDVFNETQKAIINVANEGVNELRNTKQPSASSMGTANESTRRQWNKYAKSWDKQVDVGTNFVKATIHNKKHYQLTHLLENGHMTRNGTKTRAFKHIQPIAEQCNQQVINAVEEALK